MLLASAAPAEAQRRGPWGPWGPYGPWGPFPRYYDMRDEFNASVRIEVEPKNADVYVDGSLAGPVDDFDGWWQRLWLSPGEHEITIYLEGYRTERHTILFTPGSRKHIKQTLQALAPGESSGPRPVPTKTPETGVRDPRPGAGGGPPDPPAAGDDTPVVRYGLLSIRVQPDDAELWIDGERWKGSLAAYFNIRLSSGRHRIELRKAGYRTYAEDVLIRPDRTLALNVALSRS
jgi:hypothetical protein